MSKYNEATCEFGFCLLLLLLLLIIIIIIAIISFIFIIIVVVVVAAAVFAGRRCSAARSRGCLQRTETLSWQKAEGW